MQSNPASEIRTKSFGITDADGKFPNKTLDDEEKSAVRTGLPDFVDKETESDPFSL